MTICDYVIHLRMRIFLMIESDGDSGEEDRIAFLWFRSKNTFIKYNLIDSCRFIESLLLLISLRDRTQRLRFILDAIELRSAKKYFYDEAKQIQRSK